MLYVLFTWPEGSPEFMAAKPAFTSLSETCLKGRDYLGRGCFGEHHMSKGFSPQGCVSLERALPEMECINRGKPWLS